MNARDVIRRALLTCIRRGTVNPWPEVIISELSAAGFTIMSKEDAEPVVTVYRKGNVTGQLVWTKAGERADLPDGTNLYTRPPESRLWEADEGLVKFAKEMCRVGFEGGSIDGCDILDTAVEHGLCKITEYSCDMTNVANAEYLEEGDAIYVFTGPLAQGADDERS